MYYKGQGIPQDYKTALKWFRLAAKQGNASAQGNLGFMYAGLLKNYVYAHVWGNLATSNGSEGDAKISGTAARNMTPTQITEAQKLARECVRKKYKGC